LRVRLDGSGLRPQAFLAPPAGVPGELAPYQTFSRETMLVACSAAGIHHAHLHPALPPTLPTSYTASHLLLLLPWTSTSGGHACRHLQRGADPPQRISHSYSATCLASCLCSPGEDHLSFHPCHTTSPVAHLLTSPPATTGPRRVRPQLRRSPLNRPYRIFYSCQHLRCGALASPYVKRRVRTAPAAYAFPFQLNSSPRPVPSTSVYCAEGEREEGEAATLPRPDRTADMKAPHFPPTTFRRFYLLPAGILPCPQHARVSPTRPLPPVWLFRALSSTRLNTRAFWHARLMRQAGLAYLGRASTPRARLRCSWARCADTLHPPTTANIVLCGRAFAKRAFCMLWDTLFPFRGRDNTITICMLPTLTRCWQTPLAGGRRGGR